MLAVAAATACLAVLLLVPAAHGAEHEVKAAAHGFEFTPSAPTIAPGDRVTFSLASGGLYAHNVHFLDTDERCPGPPAVGPWSCPRTYDAVGDYAFVCDAHPYMDGTVHVRVPGSEPDPGPGPPPPGDPPPGNGTEPDVLSPGVQLGGARVQRVLEQGAVVVRVETTEAASLAATGTVNVPPPARLYRLRRAARTTSGAGAVRLRLRLSRTTRRAVLAGLTHRRRLFASVRVTATDAAGNRTVKRRRIALRR